MGEEGRRSMVMVDDLSGGPWRGIRSPVSTRAFTLGAVELSRPDATPPVRVGWMVRGLTWTGAVSGQNARLKHHGSPFLCSKQSKTTRCVVCGVCGWVDR
jgi:hypothetical protein